MLYILSDSDNIFFNLATEEYLLHHFPSELCMLWVSREAIVVGKHQNTLAEINYPFVRSANIAVARRLTGGGTVYHDPGNINFTFIANGQPGKLIDFKQVTSPIIAFLNSKRLNVTQGPKNDLVTGEKKISGNAGHVYRNRSLHHGTLLYSANMEFLKEALRIAPGKYKDKAVQSNRSEVVNIAGLLADPPPVAQFLNELFDYLRNYGSPGPIYQFTGDDRLKIGELVNNKYNTRDWVFGYSPPYTFSNQLVLEGKTLNIMLTVVGGIISKADLEGDLISDRQLACLTRELKGCQHCWEDIYKLLGHEIIKVTSLPKIDEMLTEAFF